MGENPSKLKIECLLSLNAFKMTANHGQMCLSFVRRLLGEARRLLGGARNNPRATIIGDDPSSNH